MRLVALSVASPLRRRLGPIEHATWTTKSHLLRTHPTPWKFEMPSIYHESRKVSPHTNSLSGCVLHQQRHHPVSCLSVLGSSVYVYSSMVHRDFKRVEAIVAAFGELPYLALRTCIQVLVDHVYYRTPLDIINDRAATAATSISTTIFYPEALIRLDRFKGFYCLHSTTTIEPRSGAIAAPRIFSKHDY